MKKKIMSAVLAVTMAAGVAVVTSGQAQARGGKYCNHHRSWGC